MIKSILFEDGDRETSNDLVGWRVGFCRAYPSVFDAWEGPCELRLILDMRPIDCRTRLDQQGSGIPGG